MELSRRGDIYLRNSDRSADIRVLTSRQFATLVKYPLTLGDMSPRIST